MPGTTTPIVHERHFVHATRDTGYRSTASAVSELVDNALQAGATRAQVLVDEEKVGRRRHVRIAVWDDGCGMTGRELQQALQFGGSTRFDDRQGLGRFGMGLPNASVSQARRVDVFSWQASGKVRRSYLDLDEIAEGQLTAIPRSAPVAGVPRWAPEPAESGTFVVWTKCDRLDYKKASTIEGKLRQALGRIYRHLLSDGFEITVNGRLVPVIDPLFRLEKAEIQGASDYREPLSYDIKLPGSRRGTAQVIVRFTKLPVKRWSSLPAQEKRRRGIIGGAGVFVVRAGREIAHGWYFMDGKARQNYDDWWRCEVEFPPALDEMFGVTHSKQGIRPTQELNDVLAPDLGRIARDLSSEIRSAFAERTVNRRRPSAARATKRDWRLRRLPVDSGPRSAVTDVKYELLVRADSDPHFFDWTCNGDQLVIRINENHPFHSQLLSRLSDEHVAWVRRDLETLLIAYARAAEMEEVDTGSFRTTWSDVLSTFLET